MGLVFGTYIFGLLSDVIKDFSWLKYISPIKMAAPATLLKGNLDTVYLLLSISLSILAILITSVIYKRKDLRFI